MRTRTTPSFSLRATAPWALLFVVWLVGSDAKNMNGAPGQYKIANGLDSNNKAYYKTDYDVEYFDVYSEVIKTRYSQVFWRGMAPIPLPSEIVARFANNKTMAVVGYEVDQVIRGKEGEDDVSVPITHAYNHHYCSWLVNSHRAKLVKVKVTPEEMKGPAGFMTHGSDYKWVPELLHPSTKEEEEFGHPLVQFFSEGNGGEMRLSYHGYPKGYAQLIQSPDRFHIAPMQIDTWNREEPTAKFKPGPLPKESPLNPFNHVGGAGYSGLLECPCSDRVVKEWNMTYVLLFQQQQQQQAAECDKPIPTEQECWDSATTVLQASAFRHYQVSKNSSSGIAPQGCSLIQHANGTADVYWNPHSTTTSSSSFASSKQGEVTNEELESDETKEKEEALYDHPYHKDIVAFASNQVNVTVRIHTDDDNINPEDHDAQVVITMVGPADRWFGVGFGTNTMCLHMEADQCPTGGPYTIIVQGDHVEERQLGYHAGGRVLSPTLVQVRLNQVWGGNRTVVLIRPRKGDLFSFDPHATQLPIITARGCSMEYAQHCGHGPATLNFVHMETPARICRAGVEGTIHGRKFVENGRCAPGAMFNDHHANPTCKVETYRGGLYCCNDGQFLLDSAQEIPWADQYLEYQLKFRFYFEDYQEAAPTQDEDVDHQEQSVATKPSHQNLVRLSWATEGNAGEYDILQCRNNTPPSQCVQVITNHFRLRDMVHDCPTHRDASGCSGTGSKDPNRTLGIELIYASAHCHAPACLSMELYHAQTGELLCRVQPIYGQSVYQVFDEHGYLALPPCLWGREEEGLAAPILLPLDTELLSIKRNNNTLPHTGEMALWQMRGVVVPKEQNNTMAAKGRLDAESYSSSETMAVLRRRRREGI